MTELIGKPNLLIITGRPFPTSVAIVAMLSILSSLTGSDSCHSAVFYLLCSPTLHLRPTQEILHCFPAFESIRGEARLNRARHLCASSDGAMHILPGVPGLFPREIEPGGVSIVGQNIPANSAMHNDHVATVIQTCITVLQEGTPELM